MGLDIDGEGRLGNGHTGSKERTYVYNRFRCVYKKRKQRSSGREPFSLVIKLL